MITQQEDFADEGTVALRNDYEESGMQDDDVWSNPSNNGHSFAQRMLAKKN